MFRSGGGLGGPLITRPGGLGAPAWVATWKKLTAVSNVVVQSTTNDGRDVIMDLPGVSALETKGRPQAHRCAATATVQHFPSDRHDQQNEKTLPNRYFFTPLLGYRLTT